MKKQINFLSRVSTTSFFIGLALVVLRACGAIQWHWALVTLPMWWPFAVVVVVVIFFFGCHFVECVCDILCGLFEEDEDDD